ncbi:hypothetical protein PFISCL1PPCAC_22403, partial [Pristionchus fissidentatus]
STRSSLSNEDTAPALSCGCIGVAALQHAAGTGPTWLQPHVLRLPALFSSVRTRFVPCQRVAVALWAVHGRTTAVVDPTRLASA